MNTKSTILAEMLLEKSGKSVEDLSRNSHQGQLFRRQGVRPGAEFARIRALPRRVWSPEAKAEAAAVLTKAYRTKSGTQTLRPDQAVALIELHDNSGEIARLPVGQGKTHISFLAPLVLKSKRPLLLLPAKLVHKTEREFQVLAQHWQCLTKIEILSYEKLSREKQSDFLDRYEPDLVMCDEAHRAKNQRSARTKRIKRYIKAHPDTIFLPLSGTLARRSLLEYAHLSEWALKDKSPVPRTSGSHYVELDEWRRALDENCRDQEKMAPGCLVEFSDKPSPDLQDIRDGFSKWRRESPGWISVESSDVDCSILLVGEKFDKFPSHVDDKFAALRESYQTPDGESFAEPQKLWQYLRQCSMGFWYRLDPPPPKAWKDARKNWAAFVREILSMNKPHLDSELQVARAVSRGELLDHGIYNVWKEIKPSYNPDDHRVTEWFDDSFLSWCIDWLNKEKGVLFTPYRAVGQRVKKETGIPYFAEGGRDPDHGFIEEYKAGGCVASLGSNSEGRNLQYQWSTACLVGGSGNSVELEQLIGRLHRLGQEADEVELTLPYGCIETLEALWNARREAEAGEDKTHKLLVCDLAIDSLEEAEAWTGSRWTKN